MPENPWVEIAFGPWAQISELALLLGSQFLPYRIDSDLPEYRLYVLESDLAKVAEQLKLYREENPPQKAKSERLVMPSGDLLYVLIPPFVGTAWGVFQGNYAQWKTLGLAHAELIRQGEIYRVVTALTLHQDSGHLFSNLLAAWCFAFFLQNRMSLGLLSLLSLIAGAFANTLEAYIWESHRSLGFSTATFAMLGILISLEFSKAWQAKSLSFRPWLGPLLGGSLLALTTGVSPEVDVMAHLLGLLCGMAIAALFWKRNLGAGSLGTKFLLFSWFLYALNWAIAVYL